jgi:hypothetical protein
MAGVRVKANLWRMIGAVGVVGAALTLAGCPELALKGAIRALAAPSNVQSLKVVNGGSKQFKVTWRDPADSDVDHIEISLQSPFSSDPAPSPVTVPVGVQQATVTTPFNSVQYVVIVKSVDKAGNKSPGAVYGNVSLQGNLLLPSTQASVLTLRQYSDVGLSTIMSGINYLYNTDGTISEKDYYTGAGLSWNGYTYYTYVNGQLTEDDTYDALYVLTGKHTYLYDSRGNLTEKRTYDPSLFGYETYEYDANGNQTRVTEYNSSDVQTGYTAYTYDSNNRIVTLEEASVKLVLSWDPTTDFLSRADFIISGNMLEYITWKITPGQQMVQAGFNPDGTSAGTPNVTTYDSHGFIQQIPYGNAPDGSSTNGANDYTYDINGNLSTESDFDSTPAFYQGWRLTY